MQNTQDQKLTLVARKYSISREMPMPIVCMEGNVAVANILHYTTV